MAMSRTQPVLKIAPEPAASLPVPAGAAPTRMSFLITPRFNMASLITMIEPLRIANYLAPSPLYDWEILSLDGHEIAASNGLSISAATAGERLPRGTTLFVLASWGAEHYDTPETFSWLRRQARAGVRICAVENGSYLVARAGLLSGRRAALHWSWAPGFQERFPDIEGVEQLFTLSEPILTCAGGMAGTDLMLRLVADAHGQRMASEVAGQMLHEEIRAGHGPQRRAPGQGADQVPPLVSGAMELIEQHISEPLTVPAIASALGVSQRQLERQFSRSVGCTVVQYGTLLRLQHARVLLISTRLSVREVAAASGFNGLSHFAYAFRKCFDRKPSDYRQSWPKGESSPSWPGTLSAFVNALQGQGKARPAAAGDAQP